MRRHLGWMLIACGWAVWAAAVGGAQTSPSSNPAPCSVAPEPEPCGTKPAAGATASPAEKFPFPGDLSGAPNSSAPDAPAPNISGVPQAPEAPVAAPSPAEADKKFPFPGDASKSDATKPDAAGAGANSSSSSSSSSSSNGDVDPVDPDANPDPNSAGTPGLKDKGSEGSQAQPGRHLLHRVNPIGTKLQTADEREAEDLDVAQFYTKNGDLQGAYLRSQDAVKTAPDDPDAHFALAEAALKLNKRDEAIAEYNACLKLDPSDKEAKDARKALARLNP